MKSLYECKICGHQFAHPQDTTFGLKCCPLCKRRKYIDISHKCPICKDGILKEVPFSDRTLFIWCKSCYYYRWERIE